LGSSLTLKPGAFVNFWPPSGLFVATLLLNKPRHWLAFVIAAIPANVGFDLLHGRALPVSAMFCCGNCVEALAGAWLTRRFVSECPAFSTVREVVAFSICSALLNTALGAFVGAAAVTGIAGGESYWTTWLLWWSGDTMGVLVFAPLLIVWLTSIRATPWRAVTARHGVGLALLTALCLWSILVFDDRWHRDLNLEYSVLPWVLAMALGFGVRGATLATLIVSLCAGWCTARGHASFVIGAHVPTQTVVAALQMFLAVLCFTGLLSAAILAERQRAADALRGSEEKHKQLIDTTGTGYAILDDQGRVADANLEYVRLAGRQRMEEILGHDALEWTALQDRERTSRAVRTCLEQGFSRNLEINFVTPAGQETPVEINATVFRAAGASQIVMLCRNITQRTVAKETLLRERNFTKAALDRLPGLFYVLDGQNRFLRWNRNFETVSGYSAEELSRLSPLAFFEEPDKTLIAEQIEQVFKGGELHLEAHFVAKDHTRTPYFFTGMLLRFEQEACLIGMGIEITARKRAEDELKFRNLILATQQEAAIDGILVVDANDRVLCRNSRFAEMWGLPTTVLATDADDPCLRFAQTQVADSEGFLEKVKYLYDHRHETSRDEIVLRDGRTFDRYSAPMMGENGAYYGRVWYFRDITERKRAEEDLTASRSRLEAALEAAGMGSYQAEAGFRIFALDDRTRDIFGIETSERVLEVWTEHLHADDRPRLLEITQQVEHGNRNHETVEYRYQHPNRGIVWIRHAFRVLGRDARGGMTSLVGAVQDITEQKRAEEQIELLKHSIDVNLDGAYWIDNSNKFVYVNDAGCQVLGYQRDELIGKPVSTVNSRATENRMREVWAQLRLKRTFTVESVHRRKDGSEFPVEVSSTYVEFGGKEYNCGFARDITDRKQWERALSDYNVRLRSLAAMLALTEEEERRRLAGVLHDDIGQDLAFCNIRLGVLISQVQGTQYEELVQRVRGVLEGIIKRTRSLTFEISPPILYDVGLTAALTSLCESTQQQYDLICTLDADVPGCEVAQGARLLLYHSARELVHNVVKHAHAKTARLTLRLTGREIALSVTDDGQGMTTDSPGVGGFGLFSLRERVGHLGGTLQLHSARGIGTEVTIRLPRQ
jgi:PAS domain S-box-containing protein